jgi:hypothetical protein
LTTARVLSIIEISFFDKGGVMKGWESIHQPDWLKGLQSMLILGLAVVGASAVFDAAAARGESLQLELPASAVSGTVDYNLREGAAVAAVQDVTVTVTDPSLEQRAVWVLTVLPAYAVVVALLILILRIVWSARRGDPFTLATVRRLRVLAWVTLAGGYLAFIVEIIAAMHLSSTVLVDAVAGSAEVPLHWFLIGFGMLAVAEVVKRGVAMRAELETVV